MTIATMSTRRRIVLPAEVCDKLGLTMGSKLDVTVNAAGEFILRPLRADTGRQRGMAESAKRPSP